MASYRVTIAIANDLAALSVVTDTVSATDSESALISVTARMEDLGYVLDTERGASVEVI